MKKTHQLNRRKLLSGLSATAVLPLAASIPFSHAIAQDLPRAAPQWDILEWINGDGGNVEELRGKVIIIDFFQLWCPGCNEFSGPLLKSWQTKYGDAVASDDLVLVKIHTVFEGRNYQTVQRLKRYVKEKAITIPVGVDRHRDNGDRIPITMRRYRTRGTPEMAIIDREGMIQFQQFGYFDPPTAETLIDRLLGAKRA
ncbi:MAG: TlpA disulfide reductase family protein [Filomicrobium sp.]